MTYAQYQRRRRAAANRIALAIRAGNAAVASGDWRRMSAAAKEHDEAYLAFCAVQAMIDRVYVVREKAMP
jgi:hypothetical protein